MIHDAVLQYGIHKKKNYSGHSNVLLPRIRQGKVIEGTQVIRIYVKKKEQISALSVDDVIPQKIIIDGKEYETDIVEVDAKALSLIQKIRPIQPGYSIGHYLVTAGTIGAILYFNGQPLVLSNNHVLANSSTVQLRTAYIGDAIIQPGVYDKGQFTENNAGDCVASLYSFIPIDVQNVNLVDCALASPLTNTIINPQYPNPINSVIQGFKLIINQNDQLQYIGRSSGYKKVNVTDPSAYIQVSYQYFIANFNDVFIFSPGAIPGDSGSGMLDFNNYLAGLVFAGDVNNNTGIGVKISNILNAFSNLGIKLDYKPPQQQLDNNSVVCTNHSFLQIGTPTVTVEYNGNTITIPVIADIYLTIKNQIGQTVYLQYFTAPIYPKEYNHVTAGIFPINLNPGTYECHTFATTTDNRAISTDTVFSITIS